MENLQYRVERSLRHSFLYIDLKEEQEVSGNSENYENKMLFQTEIPGALSLSFQNKDGQRSLCYDISTVTEMKRIFEKKRMGEKQLLGFMEQLNELLSNLEQYLLPENYLLLKPELIFFDESKARYFFTLLPGRKEDFIKQLRELFSWITEHIDEESEKAIVLAFKLSRRLAQENFKMGDLLPILEHRSSEQEEELRRSSLGEDGVFRFYSENSEKPENTIVRTPGPRKEILTDVEEFEKKNNKNDKAEEKGKEIRTEKGFKSDLEEQEAEYELEVKKPGFRVPFRLPGNKKMIGKIILGILAIIGIPCSVYFLEGRAVLMRFLPLILIVEAGIVVLVVMDMVLNGMEE